MRDPNFHEGYYYKKGVLPHNGLATARQFAMLLYKSWETYNSKFNWSAKPPYDSHSNSFAIQEYLTYNGDKFAVKENCFDPNCYMLLSKCSDLTHLKFRGEKALGTAGKPGESYLDAITRIKATMLIMGITNDVIVPISEQRELYYILRAGESYDVNFDESFSVYGHDAFLLDGEYFQPKIKRFLKD